MRVDTPLVWERRVMVKMLQKHSVTPEEVE